jgi:hypothetical protein
MAAKWSHLGFCLPFVAPLFAPWIALGADGQTMTGACDRTFEADLRPGREIRMYLRSGDVDITGADAEKLVVSCELDDNYRARDVKIRFTKSAKGGELLVRGGPVNNFRLRIQVPKNSNLLVRCPAGDVTLRGVTGDKDVEVHAGDLVIEVGDAAGYRHADASLLAGDLSAPAFKVEKDGLFRSFRTHNPGGKYVLHAHVGAGDITLRN